MGSEWPVLTLEEAGVELIDCLHKTPPAVEVGVPYVAIPEMGDGRLHLETARRISEDDFREWTKRAMPSPGDIVLSRRCNPGETAAVAAGQRCALGQNLVLLRASSDRVDRAFLRWLLRGPDWWDQVRSFINVGAVFDSLKCRDIPAFRLPIPPLPEQRAIAHVLGMLDNKIELNRRMNETLEAMARAIFKSWFIDFDPVRAKAEGRQPPGMDRATAALFPDSFQDSELGKIPEGWEVATIRDCCLRVENGGTPKRGEPSYWDPPEVPWLTSGEVRQDIVSRTDNSISAAGLAASSAKLWPAGTTVVALYGATAGEVCLLSSEMCANQACCGLVPGEHHQHFTYLHLSANTAELGRQARGSAQQNLSQGIVADTRFVTPPPAVRERFEAAVSPFFGAWIANITQSDTLAATRDALLPRLLSGDVRVKDAERFVEVAP